MKILRKICAILLSLAVIFTISGCKEQGKQIYMVLGNPSSNRFREGQVANCVWDMHVFNDKLYIGSGDYNKNTRPTDIWQCDVKTNVWLKSGSVEDETVARFLEIGGKLVATGIDPMEEWELGNYYTLEATGWKKTRTLPNAVHNFDMVEYDGKLFAAIGTDHGYSPFLVSTNGGETFTSIPLKNNDSPVDLEQYYFSRAYEFLTFNGKLYGVVRHTYLEKDENLQDVETHTTEIYEYSNGVMNSVADVTDKLKVFSTGINLFGAKAVFNDKAFVCSDTIYYTTDMKDFTKVILPNRERVSDFVVENGVMYVLAFKYENKKFNVRLYKTPTGEDEFTEVFHFSYEVPPICMVKLGSTYYLGMGNKTAVNKHNGDVLKIDTTKL